MNPFDETMSDPFGGIGLNPSDSAISPTQEKPKVVDFMRTPLFSFSSLPSGFGSKPPIENSATVCTHIGVSSGANQADPVAYPPYTLDKIRSWVGCRVRYVKIDKPELRRYGLVTGLVGPHLLLSNGTTVKYSELSELLIVNANV